MTFWANQDQTRVLVQAAPVLPASDEGWTLYPWIHFGGGDEAVLPALGSATLRADFGVLRPPTGTSFEAVAKPALLQHLVRLLARDDTGSVLIGGRNYRPFWHGQVTGQRYRPDGGSGRLAGGMLDLQCVGILSLADQIALNAGHLSLSDGSSGPVRILGELPPLNDPAWGPTTSDVSAALTGGARATRVYRRLRATSTGTKRWTALQYIDYLCALFWPQQWGSLTLTGDTSALNYFPDRQDFAGLTLLQAINSLIDPQRAITARPSVNGQTVEMLVRTGSPVAIVTPAYTLPANTDTVTFDATGRPLTATTVNDDASSQYGSIALLGGRPWVGITGKRPITGNHMFTDGWNATEAAAWSSNPRDGAAARVYRRFAVNPAWNGQNYLGNPGLRGVFPSATDATYGTGGLTGARTAGGYGTANPDEVPADLIELTETLPGPTDGESLQARCYWKKGATIRDVSDTWSLGVENDPPAIILDDGSHGQITKAYIDAGYELLISIGVREVQPLKVSWIGDEGNLRTKEIRIPGFTERLILSGTLLGAATSSALVTYVDQIDDLRAQLALARARFAVIDHSLDAAQHGTLDVRPNIGRPGQLVTTVDTGDDSGPRALNLMVTRRAWSPTQYGAVDGWMTQYLIERINPETGIVL